MLDQRSPLALVLDASMSMEGEPMERLNDGLEVLEALLARDLEARERVEILVVKAGGELGVEVAWPWTTAREFEAPRLHAGGGTPLGAAMAEALQGIQERRRTLTAAGRPFTRPWLVLVSDGAPDDIGWMKAAEACRRAERAREVTIFAVAVGDARLDALGHFCRKHPRRLRPLAFRDLFAWIAGSMMAVSRVQPGALVKLPEVIWAVPARP